MITPPPELVQQWAISSPIQCSDESWAYELFITHQAAQWGADQELEACCEWTAERYGSRAMGFLRAARRPKPPSSKAQALDALKHVEEGWRPVPADCDTIRRALEQLND